MKSHAQSLLEAITVTAELTGMQFSEIAKAAMVEELMGYEVGAVLSALSRCRRECKSGRFSLADVLDRIDDGRPSADEAWGMYPHDEDSSAVVTEEMNLAMRNAWPLLQEGDRIAARMAFKSAYEKIVQEARERCAPVHWAPTLGENRQMREGVLVEAVAIGRISSSQAMALLPEPSHDAIRRAAGENVVALPAPSSASLERLGRLVDALKNGQDDALQERAGKRRRDREAEHDAYEAKRAEALSHLSKMAQSVGEE